MASIHAASSAITSPAQPAGTFLPATKVLVGNQKVVIDRYLSEGGFAHVYVVRIPRENGKHEVAVLKRVAVPDKEHLASMRTEVETMKKLKGHKHVVTYMDSHASQLKGGGYEVFLLMEYCGGGGLIDFMNTRLQHRLTEPEILKIFGEVSEGLACMHYLKPPLLHRDLKVENVLIGKTTNGQPIYKLCDFGSTAPPRPAAMTTDEGRLIEEDVQKHTTMQYRSPEMIDVWRKQPIDEKADIWALGVFLYKLCYYTTPFEDVGQMAILNASYKFPTYPSFSDRLKKLIASMLKEDPEQRPNIYQVIKEVCSMRGVEVPIKDIYANRTQSEARKNESLPNPEAGRAAAVIGLQKTAPQTHVQSLPDITPGRRGRPTAPAQPVQPNPSPVRGDPFAALDSKNFNARAVAVDEMSKRFPSLDEFSIAHEKSGTLPFQTSPVRSKDASLNDRVTTTFPEAKIKVSAPILIQTPNKPTVRPVSQQSAQEKLVSIHIKPSDTDQSRYKSTGVGSSPPAKSSMPPPGSSPPIWRISDQARSSSQPSVSAAAQVEAGKLQPSLPPTQRPALYAIHRSKSQTSTNVLVQPSASSRASMEDHVDDAGSSRAKSVQSRSRPSSLHVSSNMDFLRDQENTRKRPSMEMRRPSRQNTGDEEVNIDNDLDFLRNNEDSELGRRKSNRKNGVKRSSLGSLSGAKQMIAGRFGDALKRFESKPAADADLLTADVRTGDDEPRLLSPIEGSVHSEATPSRHSDMDSAIDETEDLPPDIKREWERRRLSQEERRVAKAAAEYRARVTAQGTGGAPPNKAANIQKRVQSLLDEGRQSPVKRTADGYGRHTDQAEPRQSPASSPRAIVPPVSQIPSLPFSSINAYPKTRTQQTVSAEPHPVEIPLSSPAVQPSTQQSLRRNMSGRAGPSIPPKATSLRTGGGWQASRQQPEVEQSLPPRPSGGSGLAALLAKDLEGVPDYPPKSSGSGTATPTARPAGNTKSASRIDDTEDLAADFSKRYPSLAGIEMVETEITGSASPGRGNGFGARTRMREV